MDYKALIEKYFAGETSLEEEQLLKTYFSKEAEVEDSLKAYMPLFRFFAVEKARVVPAGFDERLDTRLKGSKARRFRLNPLRVAVAAAIIALALVSTTLVYRTIKPVPETAVASVDWSKYEPKTPEEAYQVARNALMKVSGGLNRGTKLVEEQVEFGLRGLKGD